MAIQEILIRHEEIEPALRLHWPFGKKVKGEGGH